jgi:hypothetical protein
MACARPSQAALLCCCYCFGEPPTSSHAATTTTDTLTTRDTQQQLIIWQTSPAYNSHHLTIKLPQNSQLVMASAEPTTPTGAHEQNAPKITAQMKQNLIDNLQIEGE